MKYGELNLGQIEAIVNKLGGMGGVSRFLSGELTIKASDLLRQVATVNVADVNKFVASDNFRTNNPVVKIAWLGDNFKRIFLGKTEEGVEATTLTIHKLEKTSRDPGIMAELGEWRTETSLAHLYELLKKQPNGESGVLLTNGYANIFYIRGTDGNFWAVLAHWPRDGWYVLANSVENPDVWYAGRQVVSR